MDVQAGRSTQWRVQTRNEAGEWSVWSDWASWTYMPKPSLTMDSPLADVITDNTPTVIAHLNTILSAWRVLVAAADDRSDILYDSGKRPADDPRIIAHTIPERNEAGRRVFVDDTDYQICVRAWDAMDRESTPGDPPYTQQWVTVHFDDDATLNAPFGLTVAQAPGLSPRTKLTWDSLVAPDEWVIYRNAKIATKVDPADVATVGGFYTWTDGAFAEPFRPSAWKVKALFGGRMSNPSNIVTFTSKPEGVWLLAPTGDVRLDGVAVGGFRTRDRRATYKPINKPYDVDIITGMEGLSGTFTGSIEYDPDLDLDTQLARLATIKKNATREVRMVYGEKTAPVRLRNLSVVPDDDYDPERRNHLVEFEFWQVGNFHGEVD